MSDFSPISDLLSYPSCAPSEYDKNQSKIIVLSDFDGTISLEDVTDTLLEKFADKKFETIEEEWLAGKIGSKECMRQQVALMTASKSEMDKALAEIEIDLAFKEFVKTTKELNIPLHILSDGLDYAIQSILLRHDIILPVFANRLYHNNQKEWRIEFPYKQQKCIKASGNCKCKHANDQYQHFDTIVYIGDGTSDYCVSHKVGIVLAKSKLVTYCQANQIKYIEIPDFTTASQQLKKIVLQQKQV